MNDKIINFSDSLSIKSVKASILISVSIFFSYVMYSVLLKQYNVSIYTKIVICLIPISLVLVIVYFNLRVKNENNNTQINECTGGLKKCGSVCITESLDCVNGIPVKSDNSSITQSLELGIKSEPTSPCLSLSLDPEDKKIGANGKHIFTKSCNSGDIENTENMLYFCKPDSMASIEATRNIKINVSDDQSCGNTDIESYLRKFSSTYGVINKKENTLTTRCDDLDKCSTFIDYKNDPRICKDENGELNGLFCKNVGDACLNGTCIRPFRVFNKLILGDTYQGEKMKGQKFCSQESNTGATADPALFFSDLKDCREYLKQEDSTNNSIEGRNCLKMFELDPISGNCVLKDRNRIKLKNIKSGIDKDTKMSKYQEFADDYDCGEANNFFACAKKDTTNILKKPAIMSTIVQVRCGEQVETNDGPFLIHSDLNKFQFDYSKTKFTDFNQNENIQISDCPVYLTINPNLLNFRKKDNNYKSKNIEVGGDILNFRPHFIYGKDKSTLINVKDYAIHYRGQKVKDAWSIHNGIKENEFLESKDYIDQNSVLLYDKNDKNLKMFDENKIETTCSLKQFPFSRVSREDGGTDCGYKDEYRGWYKLKGEDCPDKTWYCRWVGNAIAYNKNPSKNPKENNGYNTAVEVNINSTKHFANWRCSALARNNEFIDIDYKNDKPFEGDRVFKGEKAPIDSFGQKCVENN